MSSSGDVRPEWIVSTGRNAVLVRFNLDVVQSDPMNGADALNPENYNLSVDGTTYRVGYVRPGGRQDEVELVTLLKIPESGDASLSIASTINPYVGAAGCDFDAEQTATTVSQARNRATDRKRGDVAMSLPGMGRFYLGTYAADGRGDYALSGGLETLRKRMIRRLTVPRGSFVHLPSYGIGIEKFKGRNVTDNLKTTMAEDVREQMLKEPEIESVDVTFRLDGSVLVVKVSGTTESGVVEAERAFDWEA
jgi:phage baseplate assembly protein W